MSILVDKATRLVVQGIADPEGAMYVERIPISGSRIVAGVTFGQGGSWFASIPVFDTVREAVHATDANAALVCVHASEAAEAILEATDAGLELVICLTNNVPVQDMILVRAHMRHTRATLVGPGTPGVFSPGQCLAGVMPEYAMKPGSVGVVSRSGSLAYEVTWLLTQNGLGQTTVLGTGGGLIVGTGLAEALAMFEDDPVTRQVALIGEIGSQQEELAAQFVADHMTKPVVAFVAGQTAPAGRQMGHPSAVIEDFRGTAEYKIEVLESAGVRVARSLQELPELLERGQY
jgi:succinyl-CoA synthetase alpha subunit